MRALVLDADWVPKPGDGSTGDRTGTRQAVDSSRAWRRPTLSLLDVPDPEIGPDDVLVRPMAVGINEVDIELSAPDGDGGVIYAGRASLPRVLGQELAGRVEEAGQNVTNVRVGDYVTAEAFQWCGHCEACRVAQYNHCETPQELGRTIDGAFAECIRIASRFCWPIDDLVERYALEKACELGSMILPLATIYNGLFIQAGGFLPGETVAVYGSGLSSLCAIALARAAGAGQIVAFEEVASATSSLAGDLGATAVHSGEELGKQGARPYQVIMEATRGVGAAIQIQTSEVPSAFQEDMERGMATLGRLVCTVRQSERRLVDIERLIVSLGRLHPTQGHGGYAIFPNLIELLRSGAADLTSAIRGRFRLEDMRQAMRRAKQEPESRWIMAETANGKGVGEEP